MTILSDEKNGLRALQFHCIQETEYPILKLLKISSPVKEYTTPMRMLIEYMPGNYDKAFVARHYTL